MEVLENQKQRLLSRFPQQQPPHSVERALATVGGIERPPLSVVHGHVEEGHERRQRRLERPIECEELARDLFPDLAEVVPVLTSKQRREIARKKELCPCSPETVGSWEARQPEEPDMPIIKRRDQIPRRFGPERVDLSAVYAAMREALARKQATRIRRD